MNPLVVSFQVEDGSVSTDSFCFSKDDEPMKDKTDVQNLTHTVSFYRKQQADVSNKKDQSSTYKMEVVNLFVFLFFIR